MSDKMNIFLDMSNLSIDKDEFRYKYSYADIVYMIEEFNKKKTSSQSIKANILNKLEKIEADLISFEKNLIYLNYIKQEIDSQAASNPSDNPSIPSEENSSQGGDISSL